MLVHIKSKEVDFYQNLNIKNVLFIEPIKFLQTIVEKIKNIENFSLLQIALGSKDEIGEIFIADAGETDNLEVVRFGTKEIRYNFFK